MSAERRGITRHSADECSNAKLARDMGRSRYYKCRICRLWICGACEGGDDSPLKDNGPVCDPCWCMVTSAIDGFSSLPTEALA